MAFNFAPAATPAGNLFSFAPTAPATAPAPAPFSFGAAAPAAAPAANPFNAKPVAAAAPTLFSFGTIPAPAPASGSLFGANSFASPAAAPAPSPFGAYGVAPAAANVQAGTAPVPATARLPHESLVAGALDAFDRHQASASPNRLTPEVYAQLRRLLTEHSAESASNKYAFRVRFCAAAAESVGADLPTVCRGLA